MQRSVLTLCATAALLAAAPVRADEAEEAGQRALAAVEKGFDERIAGTTHLGVYMGTKSLGTIVMTFERAPEGSGAVYRQRVVMEFAFGPNKRRDETVALFDARLGLVRSEQVERETAGEEVKESKKVTRREGDGWVRELTIDGTTHTFKAAGGENHEESLMLVLAVIGTKPGKYALRGIKWPKAEGGEAAWQALKLEVGEAAEIEHRGAKVSSHTVMGTKGDEEPMKLVLSAEGKVLVMAPSGAPIRMIAGTAEEVKKDLPAEAKPKASAGEKGVKETMELYFRVLSGEKPIDDLDRAIDWKAIHAQACEQNPDVATVTPQQFGELTKAEIKKSVPVITAEQVNMIVLMLKISEDGDKAEAKLPGDKTAKLRKLEDGTWRIYGLPE